MGTPAVERFLTRDGRRIYRLPLEVFPGFSGNAYLVLGGEKPYLVDCGSGMATSNRDLDAAFVAVRDEYGEVVTCSDLGAIVITHGHIDHFGGLAHLRRQTDAPVAVHVLDRRVLASYEERVAVAGRRVRDFFFEAGLSAEKVKKYMALYGSTKSFFRSLPVDLPFEEGAILGGEMVATLVPGHCPGQVCLAIDDILLTADHLLAMISPHISPESITLNTGLFHYLDSLDKVGSISGVSVGLGGHGRAMDDVYARAEEIRCLVQSRLEATLDLLFDPRPIALLSRDLFGSVRSYHVLLAILETGAYVEYLYHLGEIEVVNTEDLESGASPKLLYQRI